MANIQFTPATRAFGWSVNSINGPDVNLNAPTGTWTVVLSNVAPSQGVVVNLQSSDLKSVTVPTTVTVPSGKSSVTFSATRGLWQGGPAKITASLVNSSKTNTISTFNACSIAGMLDDL